MGFTFRSGQLQPLDGSRRACQSPPIQIRLIPVFASQIAFTPQGFALVVTVKGGSPQISQATLARIHVFPLDPDGLPSALRPTRPRWESPLRLCFR